MGPAEGGADKLWAQYSACHDRESREQLILCYVPLVKRVVNRLGIVETAAVERLDLVEHGLTGLIEAVDRFDPGRGVVFEAFATQRIRGSVLDAMRALDYLPRSLRRRAGEIEDAIAGLKVELGHTPGDDEVAERLGLDVEAYRQLLGQVNIMFLSLDSPLAELDGGGEDLVLGDAVEDQNVHDVMTEVEEQDLRLELLQSIRELPEREQLILSLYYYEELTIREVGEVLGLSPSRVSQLLARAIMSLRVRMVYEGAQKREGEPKSEGGRGPGRGVRSIPSGQPAYAAGGGSYAAVAPQIQK